jgi:lysozyme
MNWYKNIKESGKLTDLAKGVGLGMTMGLPLLNIPPDKTKNNPMPINSKPSIVQKEEKQKETNNYLPIVKKMLTLHEGKRNKVYNDTKGIPTIGIGFNLKRSDSKSIIESIGANYSDVLSGKTLLTDEQIDKLFDVTLKEAEGIASRVVTSFNQQPDNIKAVLVDMAFNLGPNRLSQFKEFIKAINNKDYKKAAAEMQNSSWYNQVGNRSKTLVSIVQGTSK